MAGHSKWAQIKRSKGVKDVKRGALFAKCARDIMVATKLGGPDPAGNFRLKTAIEQAKAIGLPNDNIHRAIEKGAGQDSSDGLEALSYEGYGPGGVAIFIEAMTDNRNRTAGDIRSYFNKYQGNLGTDGCVSWIFEERGVIKVTIPSSMSEELLFEAAIDAGAMDLPVQEESESTSPNNLYSIYTEPDALNDVCQALQEKQIPIDSAAITRLPSTSILIENQDHAVPLMKLLDVIESHDDVQTVYANFDMSETLLQALYKNN
jgi:YebC/PmpR family DNA-binding regulatory protein